VVETIISLAVAQVDGVAQVTAPGFPGNVVSALNKKHAVSGIIIMAEDDGQITVAVHVQVYYGYRLQEVADSIRLAVADTMSGQIGIQLASVDVYVDGIQFPE
jgi:uncharacterized alkaline shock family protein YloU